MDYDYSRQNVASLIGQELEKVEGARAHVFHENGFDTVRFVTRDTGTYEITVKRVVERQTTRGLVEGQPTITERWDGVTLIDYGNLR